MRKLLILAAAFGGLAVAPALADTNINITPEIDTWAMGYESPAVTYDGDVVVGTALPDSVDVVEVPGHADLGYVHVGKQRVIVEKKTRKVVKIYK